MYDEEHVHHHEGRDLTEEEDYEYHHYHDIHFDHHHHDHPVIVTDSDPHAQIDHHGHEYVVSDTEHHHDYDHGVEASIGEEMRHELGEIASWFADHSSSFFLSSKNDIDEARWSNYSDHIHQ